MKTIIGIVGPLACGKGVVADYLIKNFGYVSFSLSFIVHEEAKKRGITTITRTVLQDIGDDLREKEGSGVLAKRAVSLLAERGMDRMVIEGIRNPGEVAHLRTLPGFFLIAVDALQEVRFRRVIERGKPWDPKDWETFKEVDGRDSKDSTNKNGQQVRECMKLADMHLNNDTDLSQFYEAIEKTLSTRRPLRTER